LVLSEACALTEGLLSRGFGISVGFAGVTAGLTAYGVNRLLARGNELSSELRIADAF
jgi:hypothetical protein